MQTFVAADRFLVLLYPSTSQLSATTLMYITTSVTGSLMCALLHKGPSCESQAMRLCGRNAAETAAETGMNVQEFRSLATEDMYRNEDLRFLGRCGDPVETRA